MKHFLSLFVFFMFILISCQKSAPKVSSKPKWVIEESKMVDIIVDLRIIDAATYSNGNGPPRDKIKDNDFIMKKYNTQDSIFRKSHDYYCNYPKVLSSIYERAIDKLSEMEAENINQNGEPQANTN